MYLLLHSRPDARASLASDTRNIVSGPQHHGQPATVAIDLECEEVSVP